MSPAFTAAKSCRCRKKRCSTTSGTTRTARKRATKPAGSSRRCRAASRRAGRAARRRRRMRVDSNAWLKGVGGTPVCRGVVVVVAAYDCGGKEHGDAQRRIAYCKRGDVGGTRCEAHHVQTAAPGNAVGESHGAGLCGEKRLHRQHAKSERVGLGRAHQADAYHCGGNVEALPRFGSARLADLLAAPVAPLARAFALDPQPYFMRVIQRHVGGDDSWRHLS